MNILEAISKGANIASMFVPNPGIAAALKLVAGVADKGHSEATTAGTALPTFDSQSVFSLLPKELLEKILDGKKVVIEIDGSVVKQGLEDLAKANESIRKMKEAFKIN